MSVCKNCDEEMVVARFNLISNDSRMTGDYCSRKCITKHRASIPPYHDLSYLKKYREEEVSEEEEPVIKEEVIITDPLNDLDESEAEMWKSLFG